MFVVSAIAIAGIAIGLFTMLLVFTTRHFNRPAKLLVFWIAALCLNLLYFLLTGPEWENLIHIPALGHILGTGVVLLHAPVVYIFSKSLFREKLTLPILWHFLPFVIYILSIGFAYFQYQEIMEFRFGFIWFKERLFPLNYYGSFLALVSGFYTLVAFIAIRKQKSMLSQTQSGEIRNVLNWLENWILAAIIFFVLTYLVIEFSVSTDQIDPRITFQVISVFLSIYIVYVGYWAIRKTSAFQQMNPVDLLDESAKHAKPVLSDSELENLKQEIRSIIENECYYLDPDFSLSKLSEAMHVPSGKLSLAINSGLGMNFFDLINSYRVMEFKKRIKESKYDHLSLIGLAFECGFRSKSTFNSFFKKHTGMTPSSFKKNLEKRSG